MLVAVVISGLSLAVLAVSYRRLSDWRLWMIPVALALVGLAQFQSLRSTGSSYGGLAGATAVACSLAGLLAVFYLLQLEEERRRVGGSARQREQWARFLSARLPAIVWTTNRKGTVTSHVGGVHRFAGLRQNELAGKTLTELFGQGGSEAPAWKAFRLAVAGESVAFELPWQGERHEGFTEPVYDEQGGVTGTIGFLVNAVPVAAGQPSQTEAQALLDLLTSHLPVVAWIADLEGAVGFMSGGVPAANADWAESLLLAAPVELPAEPADDTRLRRVAHQFAVAGKPSRYEALLGGKRVTCHLEPLRGSDGQVREILGIAIPEAVVGQLGDQKTSVFDSLAARISGRSQLRPR